MIAEDVVVVRLAPRDPFEERADPSLEQIPGMPKADREGMCKLC
jgi:hypothetical protein